MEIKKPSKRGPRPILSVAENPAPVTGDLVEHPEVEIITEPEMQLEVLENSHRFRWNFAEIKTGLQAAISKYTGLVVTDENLPAMEKTQREIAGLRGRVDRFRKETKQKLSEPAVLFEGEVKELLDIIANAEAPLAEQLKAYEIKRQAARELVLGVFAQKTAAGMGLRPENNTYKVPSKLTNRSTTDAAALAEVAADIDLLVEKQTRDDAALEESRRKDKEAIELQKQLDEMTEAICSDESASYMLKTPITLAEVRHLITRGTTTEQKLLIISGAAKARQAVEQACAPADTTSVPDLSGAGSGPPPPDEEMPAPLPPQLPSLDAAFGVKLPPPPTVRDPLFECTIRFRCRLSIAPRIKTFLASLGIAYFVVSQSEVPDGE